MGDVVSLLDRPVYTYPQVDRLLNLTSGTSKRWLNGYRRKRVFYPPILRQEPTEARWVTWGEFVETRLFAGYRDIDNIPVQRMRRVVEVLRNEFDRTYPLAYATPYVQPEGRRMLWQAQIEAELPEEFAIEVDTGQILLAPWVSTFAESATFDEAADGAVTALTPDPDFPAVQLDPNLRGGEPVIDGRRIRVTTIASLVRGGEDITDVAGWYDLTVDEVQQAVNYDRSHLRIA
jgi:uncharacterized protein (DUF433 family)